jgi:tRNA(Ile)-lysidine synthase
MTKTSEQKVINFIDENLLIEKGDKILVALSGGADSVFLLYFLKKFSKRFGIEVSAFHLNHKLRGKTALEDAKFSVDFCKRNMIELISISKDVKTYAKKNKISVEEAGRELRYAELNKAAKKMKCNKIATAHNANDNVETILLNLFKGTGLKGLTGIPVSRKNIIRPILCLSSDEIRKYLKQNEIEFRVDESNLSNDYERNFLRNEIIPQLRAKLNPKLEEKINSTSGIISEINSYIDKQIDEIKNKYVAFDGKQLRIDLKYISKLDKAFLNIFLKSVVENTFRIELNSDNIFSLNNLLKGQTGRTTQLKADIIALKEREELLIGKRTYRKSGHTVHKLKIGDKLKIDGKTISIVKVNRKMFKLTKNKSVEFISGDGLSNNFEIRKWKTGDKFNPIGMKGTKKISDFLTDERISSLQKKDQLVVTNDGKIVWVVGLRIDERFKVKPESKNILKLTVSKR